MNKFREDHRALLERISWCLDRQQRSPRPNPQGCSCRYIFSGSYDVHLGPESLEEFFKEMMVIKKHRLEEARDLGLIINESGKKDWELSENWALTDLGQEILNNFDDPLRYI